MCKSDVIFWLQGLSLIDKKLLWTMLFTPCQEDTVTVHNDQLMVHKLKSMI